MERIVLLNIILIGGLFYNIDIIQSLSCSGVARCELTPWNAWEPCSEKCGAEGNSGRNLSETRVCGTVCNEGRWLHSNKSCLCNIGFTGMCCDKYCPSGSYGLNCTFKCNTECINKLCNHINGSCTIGCVQGYWGEKCNKKCANCDNIKCDRETGTCPHGCQAGYFGRLCNRRCSTCKKGLCHARSGKCTKGCISGYFGQRCRKTCDLLHCVKNNICTNELPGCFKLKNGSIKFDKSKITSTKTIFPFSTTTQIHTSATPDSGSNRAKPPPPSQSNNSMIPSQVVLYVFAGLFVLFLPLVLILIVVIVGIRRKTKKTSRELTQMRQIVQPVNPNTYSSFPSLPSNPPLYSETFQACAPEPTKEPISNTNEYEAVCDDSDNRSNQKRKLSAEYLECLPSDEEEAV
ncbi:DgyrCDS6418 [Dimorphilus gyrociliatus]|uniref:DgyrCDS6418 n=1 Tax=Dimorphilus gyrociliatus TaxID=2664684 RepID=A0A7I8VNQ3_9ANNE|nr:DgyrCDS6418 [Dimorphilus gyrociliatus]